MFYALISHSNVLTSLNKKKTQSNKNTGLIQAVMEKSIHQFSNYVFLSTTVSMYTVISQNLFFI